jgi:hypothetical protein
VAEEKLDDGTELAQLRRCICFPAGMVGKFPDTASDNLRSIFLQEPLVQVVGHAFGAATQAFRTLYLVCDRLAFDLVSFAFRTWFGLRRGPKGKKGSHTSSHFHPPRGWWGTSASILVLAVFASALLRLRQFKSILITHQRCTGLSSDDSTYRDSWNSLRGYGCTEAKSKRAGEVWHRHDVPPHFPAGPRAWCGFSSSCAVFSFTPSSSCLSRSDFFSVFSMHYVARTRNWVNCSMPLYVHSPESYTLPASTITTTPSTAKEASWLTSSIVR